MISVIVAVYNAEKYLEKCLDSILNQSYKDFEIVCVDDGSKDNSAAIAKKYAEKYDNVQFAGHENKGVSYTLNKGINMAKGDYIYFVDCDDYIHQDLLKVCMQALEETKSDFVYLEHRTFSGKNPVEQEKIDFDNLKYEITETPLLDFVKRKKKMPLCTWSRMVKKEFFDNYQFVDGIYCEDLHYTPMLLDKAKQGVYLPYQLYYYFVNPESISRTDFTIKKAEAEMFCIKALSDYFKNHKDEKVIRNSLINRTARNVYKMSKRSKDGDKILETIKPKMKELYQENAFSLSGMTISRKFAMKRYLK